jgi:hypothetical protein
MSFTYAAVATKTSILLVFVNVLSARQNTSEKTQTRPTLRLMLWTAYSVTTTDATATAAENIAPMTLLALEYIFLSHL